MKIGLVGFGFIGQIHYNAYEAINGGEVCSVAGMGPNTKKVPVKVPVFNTEATLL